MTPVTQLHRLSGLDAEFLAMESSAVYGHVGSVCVLGAGPRDPLDLERLTALISTRLHLAPPFRRRLVAVPLGLDHPSWVDDPDFSLDYHVREIALPRPGDDGQLARQVARLHARPLDRAHPLWELYLITGLAGDRAAVYFKIHHAAMDGVAGDDLIAAFLDPSPRPRPVSPAPPWRPGRVPGGPELFVRGALSLAVRPLRAARLAADLVRHSPGIAAEVVNRLPWPDPLRASADLLPRAGRPPLRAPRTPFNAPITPHRRWAFADLPLADVDRVRRATATTVNDVVMALVAGALRHWLADHDALPDQPLVAAVPVSVRTPGQHGTYGNRVSGMLAALPTDVADPAERLRVAAAGMLAAKQDHTLPAALLAEATEVAVPAVATLGWRLAARFRVMERVNPWNLFVSNVPGPRDRLFLSGAPLLAYYPISAIAHGQGLNITALSYHGRLCFGLLGCRTLVPDIDRMAGYLIDALAELVACTEG